MRERQLSRTGAVVRGLLYTTALPITFATVSVIYVLIVGPSG